MSSYGCEIWQRYLTELLVTFEILLLTNFVSRAYFNHLLRAVPARTTLFEKWNAFFSSKNSKNTCRLGGKGEGKG